MALIEINRVVDTLLSWYVEEKPLFDAIVSNYYGERSLTILKGIRKSIPISSLPSIEVGPVSDSFGWHAVRVQEETPTLEIHVTTDNGEPVTAIDLEGKLVSLAVRILTYPPHLRAQIQGTNTWMYDSLPASVNYGATAAQGQMRVAKITWTGKNLEYLSDQLFAPFLQGGGNWSL